VELGAIYRLCVSACTNVGNAAMRRPYSIVIVSLVKRLIKCNQVKLTCGIYFAEVLFSSNHCICSV